MANGKQDHQSGNRQRHPKKIGGLARREQRHRQRSGKFQRHCDPQGHGAQRHVKKEIHDPQRGAIDQQRLPIAARKTRTPGPSKGNQDQGGEAHAQRHRALRAHRGKQLLGQRSAGLEAEHRHQQRPYGKPDAALLNASKSPFSLYAGPEGGHATRAGRFDGARVNPQHGRKIRAPCGFVRAGSGRGFQ